MEDLTGKDAVLEAAKKLLGFIQGVEVQARLDSGNQAMLVYNMYFPRPAGLCRTAAFVTFQDGLIVRNELFFDASPFKKT